jgi:hypothetical protein
MLWMPAIEPRRSRLRVAFYALAILDKTRVLISGIGFVDERRQLGFLAWQDAFNTPVRYQPDQRRSHVNGLGNPWRTQRCDNCNEIKHRRKSALPITADRFFQE